MERLFEFWLRLTHDPLLKIFLRKFLTTLMIVGALGGLAYMYSAKHPGEKKGQPTQVDESKSEAVKLGTPFDRLIDKGDRAALITALNQSDVKSSRSDDLATRLDKIGKRESILNRLQTVSLDETDQQFILRSKLMTFIENASLAYQYDINDHQQIQNIKPLLALGIESSESRSCNLALAAQSIATIREFKLQESGTEQLNAIATKLEATCRMDPNNSELAFLIYDFLGVIWDKDEFPVSSELALAFCRGFEESKIEKITNLVTSVGKNVEDRRKFIADQTDK